LTFRKSTLFPPALKLLRKASPKEVIFLLELAASERCTIKFSHKKEFEIKPDFLRGFNLTPGVQRTPFLRVNTRPIVVVKQTSSKNYSVKMHEI